MDPRGLLIDIDGVLTVSWQPIPGAADAYAELLRRGTPFRLATNTTSRSRSEVAELLTAAGFPVDSARIVTAPVATASYLRSNFADSTVFVLSSGDLSADFEGINVVGETDNADVVVLGGAGLVYTHDQLNHVFNLLLGGAEFVAMHRNLYWRTERGMELDTGAYAMALEAAVGRPPTVMGKPSPAFFAAALDELGVEAADAMMVGDDIINDVLGAQECGMTGCLVMTGKYRPDAVAAAPGAANHTISSFGEVIEGLLDPA
ncbi:MAG: HAD-IIA family hydrolase [Acidimicrobiales bacterium]